MGIWNPVPLFIRFNQNTKTFTEKDRKKCPTKKALFEGEAAGDSCHLAVDEKALWALGSGEKTPAGI